MRRWRKFLNLTNRERLFLLNTFLLLGLVRLGLWLFSYDRLQTILRAFSKSLSKSQTVFELDKIVRAVNITLYAWWSEMSG